MNIRLITTCVLLAWLALAPPTVFAQTGIVTGSVVDQTGLVLAGATVTLRGAGVPRTAYTDEQGNFELVGVAPGTYALTASLLGFSDATVEDVTVSRRCAGAAAGRAAARQFRRHGGRDRIAQ